MLMNTLAEQAWTANEPVRALNEELDRLTEKIRNTIAPVDTDRLLDIYEDHNDLITWVTACDRAIGELNEKILHPAGFRLNVTIDVVHIEDWSTFVCLPEGDQMHPVNLYSFPESIYNHFFVKCYPVIFKHLRIPILALIPAVHICTQGGTELKNITIVRDT